MSGFAFSHQFSKRWLATPTPVKHAIIQELDDIVTLLHPDTDLNEYQFSVPNLHDKVEELLAIERDHQEKLQAQLRERELEEQRLEQERLEQHRLEQERLETERLEIERLEKERLEQQRLEQQRLEQIQLTQENEKERQAQEERLQRERQAQDDAAIAALEQQMPEPETKAVLESIRNDIVYYYQNLIAQLYAAYEQGDVDFATLQGEIGRFIQHYPGLPASDEIRSYLGRAERLEIQAALDNVRRQFLLDNNVETAVQGLRDLAQTLGDLPSFQDERQAFIEEILSGLFTMFTGYLDQEDFARASGLLIDIDRINREFRDVVEVDISGAIDLASSVLRDARRQYALSQVEKLIDEGKIRAAEEGLWTVLQEPELTSAELSAIRGLWRKMNRELRLDSLLRGDRPQRYFELKMSDARASDTLSLYEDFQGVDLDKERQLYLLGLSAVSALKLGLDDQATSISIELRDVDERSTVSETVNRLIRERITTKTPDDNQTTASD